MMAQPSYAPAPLFAPFSVIGPQFIAPQPIEVIVEKCPCRNLMITDMNHKILLKVKPYNKRFHCQRVLLDPNDNPIAKLRKKNLSMHSRWNVFRGESKESSDMLFTTNTKHMIHFKTNVSVMLANKMSDKDDCDLRIKGSLSKGNCTIYMGDSSTAVAQMHKLQTSKYANDKFTVTIQANMDYACVVALFAIVDAMENPDEEKGSTETAVGVVGAIGSIITS
ncbi:putative tubby-like protein [Helianthus annuus]|nr:putative tubby-like protein [Helianthus annuus]KAJ0851061.1 putative tubby-like protein [Helianthus annuus]